MAVLEGGPGGVPGILLKIRVFIVGRVAIVIFVVVALVVSARVLVFLATRCRVVRLL